jgi:hypothetical protein
MRTSSATRWVASLCSCRGAVAEQGLTYHPYACPCPCPYAIFHVSRTLAGGAGEGRWEKENAYGHGHVYGGSTVMHRAIHLSMPGCSFLSLASFGSDTPRM